VFRLVNLSVYVPDLGLHQRSLEGYVIDAVCLFVCVCVRVCMSALLGPTARVISRFHWNL